MRGDLTALTFLVLVACDSPPEVRSIVPALGTVTGGTRVEITGSGFTSDTAITIGEAPCADVRVESPERLRCTTGPADLVDGPRDVTLLSGGVPVSALPGAFTYECPWTTSSGRRTCGAAPAAMLPLQTVSAWVTQFQDDHGFVANADGLGSSNLADTTDFTLGTRSVFVETDGAGTARTLTRLGLPAIDFGNHVVKVWLKVSNVAAMRTLELSLGDSGMQNFYRFRLRSTQGQQWITDGDWVAFTVSWAADNYLTTGNPTRSAITDVRISVADDATGQRVKLGVNGIALVPEPMDRFPNGVVSFTFDDNHASMVTHGAAVLAEHGFPATAYLIVEYVGKPLRASWDDLQRLHEAGWDMAAHAFVGRNHDARYPTLSVSVVEDDIVDTRAWLMAQGFDGYQHCAYPGGDFSNGGMNILPLARKYYTSCRTVYQRQRELYPPSDPQKLRVFYVTSSTTLADAKAVIDEACSNREWVIFAFHKLVDATPMLSTEWRHTDFVALVEHVAASGMPVATVGDVLGQAP